MIIDLVLQQTGEVIGTFVLDLERVQELLANPQQIVMEFPPINPGGTDGE